MIITLKRKDQYKFDFFFFYIILSILLKFNQYVIILVYECNILNDNTYLKMFYKVLNIFIIKR